MFRKIHSSRDPQDTVFSELRKEFNRYFCAFSRMFKLLLERRPRMTFAAMVILLTASIAISFTCFRLRDQPKPMALPVKVSPVGDGISAILLAGEKLKKTLMLKNLVDSLISKRPLTAKDSVALDSALDRLQSIQKSNK